VLSQHSEANRIVRRTDDLQRRDHPADDLVVGERVPLGQAAGNSGTDEPLFEMAPDPMGAVQQRVVAPTAAVLLPVLLQVVDDPGRLLFLVLEGADEDIEW
jgi:hypothetical protein